MTASHTFSAPFCGFSIIILLSVVALSDAQTGPSSTVQSDKQVAIDELKKGNPSPLLLRKLVALRAVDALPILRQEFTKPSTTFQRQALAAALVALGDSDPAPFKFLTDRAERTLTEDSPFPMLTGADGHIIPKSHLQNNTFLVWCREGRLDSDQAAAKIVNEEPLDIRFLAASHDLRAAPYLIWALRARNWMLVAAAVDGLAELKQDSSISEILLLSNRDVPYDARLLIGRGLLRFHLAIADKAAETFISDPVMMKTLREAENRNATLQK